MQNSGTSTVVTKLLARSLAISTVLAGLISSPAGAALKTYAIRLKPDQDLVAELKRFAEKEKLRAGFIISAVGSVKKAKIRFANRPAATEVPGYLEIVSLSGTLEAGGAHLHGSFSDQDGKTLGGHLVEGSPIYTTAEIVIGELQDVAFAREKDPATGCAELKITPRKTEGSK